MILIQKLKIKEITSKYNNDIDLNKNMKLLVDKTSEIKYSSNDISLVSNDEKNSIGPDIVSIDNYITDISRVKSSDVKANLDKALEQIQLRSTSLKDDDFEFPNQSDLPIISDPTFSQDIGVIYIDKSKKDKIIELKKISDNKKEIANLKKQLDVNNLQNLTNDEKSKIDFLNEYKNYLDKVKFENLKSNIEKNLEKNIGKLKKDFINLDDATIRQIINTKNAIVTPLSSNKIFEELKKISEKFKSINATKKSTELKEYIERNIKLINEIESEYYFIDNQVELLRIHKKVFKDVDLTTVNNSIKSLEQSNIDIQKELDTLTQSLTQLKGGKESQENIDGLKIIDDHTKLLEQRLIILF